MRDFTKLRVWSRSRQLVTATYRATSGFPVDEQFGLRSQIRRCASSIPANIAEGCGRETPAELRRYLSIAAGSASELESHVIVCGDLGLLAEDEVIALRDEARIIRRMLNRYAASTNDW